MGQSLTSMDDEIGRALNANKDVKDIRGKQDLISSQQQKGKENEGITGTENISETDVPSTEKNSDTKSENLDKANNPSMRDKIDNLIEGYLLSGDFNVHAKSTTKVKNLTSKTLLEMHEETFEQMNEKVSEQLDTDGDQKEGNVSERIVESTSEKIVDNLVDESNSQGEKVYKLGNDEKEEKEASEITEGNKESLESSTNICSKSEKSYTEVENEMCNNDVLSKNESINSCSDMESDEQKLSTAMSENKNENEQSDTTVDKSCDQNDSLDGNFVPLIPSQKKSTTTFQTLIDRVLDNSLNCKSPPLEKTNILEAYDKSISKSLRTVKPSEQKSIEIDLTVEKSVSKINNGRRLSGANNDDMSISKTKVICLKDHIEKVLEKSFHKQMGGKNLQTIDQDQTRAVSDEQAPATRQEIKGENPPLNVSSKVIGQGQAQSNFSSQDKTFNVQELVDSMIDQSKVINKLLLPPATNDEPSLTGESTLASLERTASMNFEKNPIHCPSEVAKNDDYMMKFDQKTENTETFSSEKQKVSNLSPKSNLANIQYSTKLKYSPEQNPNVDSRYASSVSNRGNYLHQQSGNVYEQKMHPENKSNSSPPGAYHGRSPGLMQTSPIQRPVVRSDLSPNIYKNAHDAMVNMAVENQGANVNSMQQNHSPGMKSIYSSHHGNVSDTQNDYSSNIRHGHMGTMNTLQPENASAILNVRQDRPSAMSSGKEHQNHNPLQTRFEHKNKPTMSYDHPGMVNIAVNQRPDYQGNGGHDLPSHLIHKRHPDHDKSGSQTICVRDCSCVSCNTNSNYKHHGHVDHQTNTRDLHHTGSSYQLKESASSHYSNLSPRQSNRQHLVLDGKQRIEGELPVTLPVSSAMALGPSPPNHYFQQNRLQLQQSQNQYKRPQLIPSSPPIPSSREYSARNNQMQAVLHNSNNFHPESRINMPAGPMIRPNVPIVKEGMSHSPGSKAYQSPSHMEDRNRLYQNQRIHPQSHSDESWSKMRDQFQKDVNKQVQNALNQSTGSTESVLDLSVKKPQQVAKPYSEDEPLDLTCKNSSSSLIHNQSMIRMQQGKSYSDAGPTHIHHLESSVDKFCQNVRPLEEHFHRNDKLSAQFQHRIPSEHGSPKQVYPHQFRAPGSIQHPAHSNAGKALPQVINTSSQDSGGSVNQNRSLPPPLLMVSGYVPPQQGSKPGQYLPPAHSQPKQQHPQHNVSQTHQLQYQQQPAARQPSPQQLSTRQPSPQLSQQQYQQNSIQKRQESPGVSNDMSNQSRSFSKRSNNVSKHEPIQNIIGIHSASDILYLICRLCGQTYGSPYGFRKHFRNQHGFEPRAEHTIVQTISATKNAMQTPPAMIYQGTQEPLKQNNEEQKVNIGSLHSLPRSGQMEMIKNPTFNNGSSQNQDVDSQNMMMVVKKVVDQTVSNAFKNNIIPSNTIKTEILKSDQVSDLSQGKSDELDEIKFLECHECGQTFQLNDFGSYKRHCRQHGQTKMTSQYPDVNKSSEVSADQKLSDETLDKDVEESLSCICKYCNIPFAKLSFLNDHICNMHPEEYKSQIKIEHLKNEDGSQLGETKSETIDIKPVCTSSENSDLSFSENYNKFTVKILPSSDVMKMPADRMTTTASPDSSEQVSQSKWTLSSQCTEETEEKGKLSVVLTEHSNTKVEPDDSSDVKNSEDQDSTSSVDAKIVENLNNLRRQSSVDSSTFSENADTDDKSSDSTNVRYFHKKFKRKGSISVSNDVSNSKNPKLSENIASEPSPGSVKSPGANSSVSNDSELCNIQDGNDKKSEDSGDAELEMPELQPGVDFTEVDDSSSKLIVKFKCSPEGMLNKSEARHQLPFVWDRITRSQAGKNIKPPTYH